MPAGRHYVDPELGPEVVDADAFGGNLRIADGGERQAVPRAQDEIDEQDGAGRQRQCRPVGDDVARRRGAHVEQRLHPLDAGHLVGDEGGKRGAGAAAQLPELREHEPIDLGHHPGADGEIGAAQAEHDEGGRQRKAGRNQTRQHDGQPADRCRRGW